VRAGLWRVLPRQSRWRWDAAQEGELAWWAKRLRNHEWKELAGDTEDFLLHRQGGLARLQRSWGIDLMPYLGGDRLVLDLGCGPYSLLGLPRVIAVDPLARGYGRLVDLRADPRTLYVESKGESLPFADGYFDAIWCRNVLDHVHRPAELLAQAIRVLRAGGDFVLVFDRVSEGGVHHPHGDLTADWIRTALRDSGTTVIEQREIGDEQLVVVRKEAGPR
jgi:SAM-dependent methyltransferase